MPDKADNGVCRDRDMEKWYRRTIRLRRDPTECDAIDKNLHSRSSFNEFFVKRQMNKDYFRICLSKEKDYH